MIQNIKNPLRDADELFGEEVGSRHVDLDVSVSSFKVIDFSDVMSEKKYYKNLTKELLKEADSQFGVDKIKFNISDEELNKVVYYNLKKKNYFEVGIFIDSIKDLLIDKEEFNDCIDNKFNKGEFVMLSLIYEKLGDKENSNKFFRISFFVDYILTGRNINYLGWEEFSGYYGNDEKLKKSINNYLKRKKCRERLS